MTDEGGRIGWCQEQMGFTLQPKYLCEQAGDQLWTLSRAIVKDVKTSASIMYSPGLIGSVCLGLALYNVSYEEWNDRGLIFGKQSMMRIVRRLLREDDIVKEVQPAANVLLRQRYLLLVAFQIMQVRKKKGMRLVDGCKYIFDGELFEFGQQVTKDFNVAALFFPHVDEKADWGRFCL